MASLLVYVAPERLAAVLGDGLRTPGRVVSLRRAELPSQLERLDGLATLFLITVECGRAIIVATLDEPGAGDVVGEATLHQHDVTDLLARLGCDKVWLVPEWASVPRIVPPNDIDLLRYTLGLALIEEPNAASSVGTPASPALFIDPTPLLAPPAAAASHAAPATLPAAAFPTSHAAPAAPALPASRARSGEERAAMEALAQALLVAIYANPASDPPRRAYAAVLRNLDDPRSELIDLQLDRCRAGGSITEREDVLVRMHRSAIAGTLRPVLLTFEITRGFVSKCVIAEDLQVTEPFVDDPAWATVEDIACVDVGLLTSKRLVSARTARVRGRDLATLAQHGGTLAFQTLLPYPAVKRNAFQPMGAEPRGLVLDPANLSQWPSVLDGGALNQVGALKLDGRPLGTRVAELLTSKLGRRLSHLDAWIELGEAPRWLAAFERAQLPLLTLRGATPSSELLMAIERTAGAPRVIVQSAPDAPALRLAAEIARGQREIEVTTPDLFARMRPLFPAVILRPRTSLAL